MKIILVSALKISDIGGVISHMTTLGKGFEELGHDVEYLTLSSIPKIVRIVGLYGPAMIISKFSLQMRDVWHFAFIQYYMAITLVYKRVFKHYDVIIAQDGYVCNSSRLVKAIFKIPIILTVHSYVLDILSGSHFKKGNLFEKWFTKVDKTSYDVANAIIAVDTRIKNYISYNYNLPRDKLRVAINFVDTDEFKKMDVPPDLSNILGIPADKKIVFCPRRMVAKNGVIYAAESIKFIKEKIGQNFLVIFTGNAGPEVEIIKNIIENDMVQENSICLKSINHDQMKYLYNLSDIVIIPSINYKGLEEATSISAIEAMACCVPVIASNIGGLKEIIDDSKTGYLIQQKNPKIIADKIYEVLNKDQSILIRNARKYIENNCSHTHRAQEYVQLIESIS